MRSTSPEEWQQFRRSLDAEGVRPELSIAQQDALDVFCRLLEYFAVADGLQPVTLWGEFCERVLDMAALSKGNDVTDWLGRFVPWSRNIAEVSLGISIEKSSKELTSSLDTAVRRDAGTMAYIGVVV